MFLHNHPPNLQMFPGPQTSDETDWLLLRPKNLCSDPSSHADSQAWLMCTPNNPQVVGGGDRRAPGASWRSLQHQVQRGSLSQRKEVKTNIGHPSSSGLQGHFHTGVCLEHTHIYPPLSVSLCLCLFLSNTHTYNVTISCKYQNDIYKIHTHIHIQVTVVDTYIQKGFSNWVWSSRNSSLLIAQGQHKVMDD